MQAASLWCEEAEIVDQEHVNGFAETFASANVELMAILWDLLLSANDVNSTAIMVIPLVHKDEEKSR